MARGGARRCVDENLSFDAIETCVRCADSAVPALTCINGGRGSHATLPRVTTKQRALMRIHRAPPLNAE
jgi:hypothetical protein